MGLQRGLSLVDALKRQTDLIVVRESDYVSQPKPNGYRSYHVIVGIPVYCLDGMEYFPVEIESRFELHSEGKQCQEQEKQRKAI